MIGEDPRRIDHLWQRMFRGSFFKAGPILGAAISAIDIALWDIKGKALGVPVWELLGGRCRDGVVCYPHVSGKTLDELLADADRALAQGYRFVRYGFPGVEPQGGVLEPRRGVPAAIEVTEAMRRHVGPTSKSASTFTPGSTRMTPCGCARGLSRWTSSSPRTRCAPSGPRPMPTCAATPTSPLPAARSWPPSGTSSR